MKFLILLLMFLFSFSHEIHQGKEDVEHSVITYPSIVRLHPPAVHFGIVLPFATLLVGAYYALKGGRFEPLISILSFLTLLSLALSLLTGYFIHENIEGIIPQKPAMDLLHLHQKVGFVLLFISSISFLTAVLYHMIRRKVLMYLFLIINLILCIGVLYQGNLGGKLVYEYSVGVPVEVKR